MKKITKLFLYKYCVLRGLMKIHTSSIASKHIVISRSTRVRNIIQIFTLMYSSIRTSTHPLCIHAINYNSYETVSSVPGDRYARESTVIATEYYYYARKVNNRLFVMAHVRYVVCAFYYITSCIMYRVQQKRLNIR